MTAVEAFAPAKINLTLHVTGQRPDGYHLLDSLVCFADVGDTVRVRPCDTLRLNIDGPFANGLEIDESNLVLRAAQFLAPSKGAEITLTKRLPVSSGIGGGSADAAAALRALSVLWGVPLPNARETAVLGADVPVCMASSFARMSGTGEVIDLLGDAPEMSLVLINPGVGVSTPQVFRGLSRKSNPPMQAISRMDSGEWVEWLAAHRNDLEAPASAAAPVIGTVLDVLRSLPGCRLARMSGSGATCFAILDRNFEAEALESIRARYPDWWVTQAEMLPPERAAARLL